MKLCTEARLFSGEICQDCFEAVPSFRHWGDLVPKGSEAKLCGKCMSARSQAFFFGKEIRPIGMLHNDTAEWIEVPGFIIRNRGKETLVSIRYNQPTIPNPASIHGGEVRVHFADNPDWLWEKSPSVDPSQYGVSSEIARSEAMNHFRMKLGPDVRVL